MAVLCHIEDSYLIFHIFQFLILGQIQLVVAMGLTKSMLFKQMRKSSNAVS